MLASSLHQLFYDLDCGHTFHTPIKEEDVEKYSLPIVEISERKVIQLDGFLF